MRRLPARSLYRRPHSAEPAAGGRTERSAWPPANMADDVKVNMAIVHSFLEFPNLSAIVKTVLFDEDEDSISALLRIAAADDQRQLPVRIEGYGEFVVPCYADAAFKDHFRMTRCTFQVVCIL